MYLLGWPGGDWETTALWTGVLVGAYIAAFWLALVFWTARDIWQRSESFPVQTGAVMLVAAGFLPGHWLYLVLRPRSTRAQRRARLIEEAAFEQFAAEAELCPDCSFPVRETYLVCPSCSVALKERCDSCSQPVDHRWSACPYCARTIGARSAAAASNVIDLVPPAPSAAPEVALPALAKSG